MGAIFTIPTFDRGVNFLKAGNLLTFCLMIVWKKFASHSLTAGLYKLKCIAIVLDYINKYGQNSVGSHKGFGLLCVTISKLQWLCRGKRLRKVKFLLIIFQRPRVALYTLGAQSHTQLLPIRHCHCIFCLIATWGNVAVMAGSMIISLSSTLWSV